LGQEVGSSNFLGRYPPDSGGTIEVVDVVISDLESWRYGKRRSSAEVVDGNAGCLRAQEIALRSTGNKFSNTFRGPKPPHSGMPAMTMMAYNFEKLKDLISINKLVPKRVSAKPRWSLRLGFQWRQKIPP